MNGYLYRVVVLVVLTLLAVSNVYLWQRVGGAGSEPDALHAYMAQLQSYTHKLDLAAVTGNEQLADFYLHEIEETAESLRDRVPEYHGFPVPELIDSELMPAIRQLETGLGTGSDPDAALNEFIAACNACHEATGHGFVVIVRATENPYNQAF